MPTAIQLKQAIRDRLDAMRWPDSSRVFPSLSIVEAPVPPPSTLPMPIAWIAERSERFDGDNPYQSDVTVALTIYQQDLRDRTGQTAIRGDGADAGAATSRGLDQIVRRVGEQIGYLGPTYAIRNVQSQWGATQLDGGKWIVYREITFVATVSTDASASLLSTVYSSGTLAYTPADATEVQLGEVARIRLLIEETDGRSEAETEGGGWAVIQQGAYRIQVDADLRGWVTSVNELIPGYRNTGAGLEKPRGTLVYTPRDTSNDAIEFTLRDAVIYTPRIVAEFAPTREMVRSVSFVAISDSSSVADMLTWQSVGEGV